MRPTLLAFALLVTAACGGRAHPERGGEAAEPSDAAPELAMDEATARATADGLLEVWITMAAIVEQRAGDCPAMAADLGRLFDQAQPLVDIIEAAKQDPESTRILAAAMDEHAAKVTPLEDSMVQGILACKDDPAMVEVMQRMPVI